MTQAHRGSFLHPGRMPVPLPSTALVYPLVADLFSDLGENVSEAGSYSFVEASPFGDTCISLADGSTGFFKIPIDKLTFTQGTMLFWVQANYRLPKADVSNATFFSTGTNSFRMWKWNGSGGHGFVVDWNQDDNVRLNADFNTELYPWSLIGITWAGGNRFVVYLNGEAVASRQAASGRTLKAFEDAYLYVGGNSRYSQLIIDSTEWTPDMVRALYQSHCRAFSSRDKSGFIV